MSIANAELATLVVIAKLVSECNTTEQQLKQNEQQLRKSDM